MNKRIVSGMAVILAFMLTGSGIASLEAKAENEPATAMLIGSLGDGTYAQWSSTATANYPPLSGSQVQTVTGDGQYTVSFSISSGQTDVSIIDYLCLQIEGLTTDTYPSLNVKVDSVSVDGSPVAAYTTTESNVNYKYYANNKGYTRVYLTVTSGWGQVQTEDVPSNTAVTDNVSVTFTVSGMGTSAAAATTAQLPDSGTSATTTTVITETAATEAATEASAESTDDADTNSTTGDAGVAGIAAGGAIAALIALLSLKKRK
jgi:hypothetical protein